MGRAVTCRMHHRVSITMRLRRAFSIREKTQEPQTRQTRSLLAVCIALVIFLLSAATLEVPALAKARSPIAPLTATGAPNVRSAAAIAIDAKTGALLYAKHPDAVRAIASTGKIFVAMVARRRKIDLNAHTTITRIDAQYARGGSRTRLLVGEKFRNQDLLRAMLIASDNRAPTAIARAVGLSPKQLVRELNRLTKDLGLKKTRFTDPSGLNGNTSTAREMAKALAAALRDPFLAELMSTKSTTIRSAAKRPHAIAYRNTNRSLHQGRYEVLGGKTGFTTPAGYCLLIAAKFGGHPVYMAFLGANEKLTRFGDFGRVASWIRAKGNSAK